MAGAVVLALALSGLGLQAARQDLAPAVTALLSLSLRLPGQQVRVRRALVHPLGELRLSGVAVEGPALQASLAEATIEFDPLPVLRGQRPRLRQIKGSGLALQGGGARLTAAQGALGRLDGGRERVVLHEVLLLFGPQPVHVAHLGAELVGGRPQRLALSGVRLPQLGPVDLIAARGEGGWSLRGALRGGQVVAAAAPGPPATVQVELDLTNAALPLPISPVLDLSDTRISGQLGLIAHGEALLARQGTLTASGRLLFSDLTVRHPLLSPAPVPAVQAAVEGEVALSQQGGAWAARTPGLSLSLGEMRLSLAGEVVRSRDEDRYQADLELVLDELDCGRALQSLPPRLLPKLEGLGLSGRLGGVLRLSVDSRTLPEVDLVSAVDIGCQVLSDPPQADAHAALDPHLSIERPGEDGKPRRLPLGPLAEGEGFVPLRRIPTPVVRAFLVAEDNQFFQHRGFDVQMMVRALGLDLKEQSTLKGASTITQQVAKNLWLGSERALSRKLEEAALAWRLEQVVQKERLLEIYLNLVELGSGIYGVSLAAKHYFGLPPDQLTLDQGAQLAALLPAPRRGMDGAWASRYRDILKRYWTARIPATPQ
jgi:monofunctional biosynthetic peptidoglycan transglycosylase